VLWLSVETFTNLSVNFWLGVTIEGQISGNEHVEDDTEGPDVALVLVVLVNDFRGHEVWSTGHFVHAFLSLLGETKVDELDLTLAVVHDVLWLYVSVHDVHRMTMLQRSQALSNHVGSELFRVLLSLFLKLLKTVEEFSTRAVLHDQIQVLHVVVRFEVLHNVGVVQLLQDAHLVHDFCEVFWAHFLFVDYLNSHVETLVFLVDGFEDLAESACAENIAVDIVLGSQFLDSLGHSDMLLLCNVILLL